MLTKQKGGSVTKRIISMLLASIICIGAVGIIASADEAVFDIGDANRDEYVDNLDAAMMLKYAAGLI